VRISKSLTLSGGWNAGFNAQAGYTILNGAHQRAGEGPKAP